jgi:hypothetical protein|tara:strand:+ start:662 stop:1462 length:801 start_codon:yes stop_codon:yes gene_type:complete
MAVNHFFQGGNGIGNAAEKRLHENLIIEGLKIYGHDVYYLPRTLVNQDLILGEDVLSKFTSSYLIEMYMETTEGFQGEQELVSKFGLEIREDTTFTVAKRRWSDSVDDPATLIKGGRPNEGDLVYFPLMNSFFEIQFVEDQEPFFQLGNLPVYKLRCTRFEYASEKIDTNVSDINKLEDNLSIDQLNYQFSLETATDGGTGALLLESSTGEVNYLINEEYNLQTQTRDFADNNTYESDAGFGTTSTADDILDFTERNPFGEVDEGF